MTEQKDGTSGRWEAGLEVPSEVLTPDGQTVDTTGDTWELNVRAESTSTVKLNIPTALQLEADGVTKRSQKIIRLYLAERLRSVKAWTVRNDLASFRRFVTWWHESNGDVFKWAEVDESDWRGFLEHGIHSTAQQGNDFARLQSFYKWGAFQKELPDFDKETASSISLISAPGNQKGSAVRTLDPHRGPLSDAEVRLINDALEEEKGTLRQRVVVRIFLELGLRPLSLTIIRGEHLSKHDVPIAEKGEEGRKTLYQLEVPKLKGRSAEITTWYTRPLSSTLGQELEEVYFSEEDLLLTWLTGHQSPGRKIRSHMKNWVREADITSPRTGQLLHLFPRRFRRTLATDMAVQGASKVQIAQALGHKDLQNVDVYLDASAVILDRMEEDDAFDFQDEVVDLFMGKVGAPDDEDVSEQRIPGAAPQVGGLKGTTGNIGACQKSSPCSLTPPLSCYTCSKFVAFENAPHDDIRDELETWIKSSPEGVDRRIPQQHVTTLKAIRQLLQQLGDE